MAADRYPLHPRSEVDVDADPVSLFAHLDHHNRLSAHMAKSSLMVAPGSMRVEADAQQGRKVEHEHEHEDDDSTAFASHV